VSTAGTLGALERFECWEGKRLAQGNGRYCRQPEFGDIRSEKASALGTRGDLRPGPGGRRQNLVLLLGEERSGFTRGVERAGVDPRSTYRDERRRRCGH